jgi:hypothetical protein
MKCLSSLGFCCLFSLISSNCWSAEGLIEGKVLLPKICELDKQAHVFVSSKKILIYQADVPAGGTFRFHLTSGDYEVRAISKSNCHFYQEVHLTDTSTRATISANLAGGVRNPAYWSEVGYAPPIYPQMGFPFAMPYWGNFGAPIFSNFYYPSPWMNGGIMPGYFPGGGNIGMDKPNIYLSSTRSESVDISVEYINKGTRWLASVPAVGENGWHVVLNPKDAMQIENAKYPYIYFDYRGYDDNLQNTQGFCEPRNKSIEHMISLLREAKFKILEVKDFEEYWKIKMPPTDTLCVFPQSEIQLDKTAKINLTPQAHSVVRRLFVVVPKDRETFFGKAKFTREPSSAWKSSTTPQVLNFKSDVDVREWGVAFLFNQ